MTLRLMQEDLQYHLKNTMVHHMYIILIQEEIMDRSQIFLDLDKHITLHGTMNKEMPFVLKQCRIIMPSLKFQLTKVRISILQVAET